MGEIDNKREEYTEYVVEHIDNVIEAFGILAEITNDFTNVTYPLSEEEMDSLWDDVQNHDESKYGVAEFEPYRQKFFPTEDEDSNSQEIKDSFELAWEHHYKGNSHHPEYWQSEDKINMPIKDIYHMMCDWMAMSKKFNNNVWDWYSENNTKFNFDVETKNKVEDVVNLLKMNGGTE